MGNSILERYQADLINNPQENDDETVFRKDSELSKDPAMAEAVRKRMAEIRQDGLMIENQYQNAMSKIDTLTEKEMNNKDCIKISNLSRIEVKHAYCPECGKELINKYPPMFNPFTHEKQCIHECECGKKYNLEYSYPRIVFYDEEGNEILVHCE